MQSLSPVMAARPAARETVVSASLPDPRWETLTLVRRARHDLGLKDRDLAVLRGLLSLLPVAEWGGAMVVFGSNRTLAERCDGIEERTLRRRIARLEEVGLIARRQSPNGKRYVIRDASGDILLAYGIDLAPLARLGEQLAALAAEAETRAQAIRQAKALIRDRLYHITLNGCPIDAELAETARLALRRNLSPEALEEIRLALETVWAAATVTPVAKEMSASDSKNDRHILSHQQDDLEQIPVMQMETAQGEEAGISLTDCLAEAASATEMALEKPRSWRDVIALASRLAPALGVKARQWQEAQRRMGPVNAALAILGLVEATGRIGKPQAYLARLIGQAEDGVLDVLRMFRSLTRPKAAI